MFLFTVSKHLEEKNTQLAYNAWSQRLNTDLTQVKDLIQLKFSALYVVQEIYKQGSIISAIKKPQCDDCITQNTSFQKDKFGNKNDVSDLFSEQINCSVKSIFKKRV